MKTAQETLKHLFTEYEDCDHPRNARWPFVGLLDICEICGRVIPDRRVSLVKDNAVQGQDLPWTSAIS